jgi:predicted negative regulator of RcsB-dependent stress response
VTFFLIIGTILVVFGMRYYSASQQAKARLAHDQAYREIAAKAVADQADTATVLSVVQASLADIATRLGAIEKILKEID